MFHLDSIRELHLELTERCNARCPMCDRTRADGSPNPHLTGSELTAAILSERLPSRFVSRLERARLCGNFGDPAVAADCLPIAEFLRGANPSLALTMNTNGSVRDERWWFRLGRLFRGKHDAVLFALDGLEETHELYRCGTSFEKILRHAAAFIRGGGNAHWIFLVFEHNEHEIDGARERASSLGFSAFTVKRTKRFARPAEAGGGESVPAFDSGGAELHRIRPARDPRNRHPNLDRNAEFADAAEHAPIRCRALGRGGLYISAAGLVFPCCWLGAAFMPPERDEPRGELARLLGPHEDGSGLNLRIRTLEEILAHPLYVSNLERAWAAPGYRDGRPRVCSRICGERTADFEDQFIRSEGVAP